MIREAMRGKDMVALGRVVLAKRERVIMLQPWDKGADGHHAALSVRAARRRRIFRRDPGDEDPARICCSSPSISSTPRPATSIPSTFVDHYEEAVVEMLKQSRPASPVSRRRPRRRAANVVNLMDALRKSVAAEKGSGKAAPAKKGKKGMPRSCGIRHSSNSRSRAASRSSRKLPPRPSWSLRRLRRARSGSRLSLFRASFGRNACPG